MITSRKIKFTYHRLQEMLLSLLMSKRWRNYSSWKTMKLTPKKDILMNFLEETWKYILPSSEYTCIWWINKYKKITWFWKSFLLMIYKFRRFVNSFIILSNCVSLVKAIFNWIFVISKCIHHSIFNIRWLDNFERNNACCGDKENKAL